MSSPTGVIVLRAEQPHLPAFTDLRLGHLGVMLGRPALGLAELRAWAQRQYRAIEGQAELGQRRLAGDRVDLQARPRIRFRQLGTRLDRPAP